MVKKGLEKHSGSSTLSLEGRGGGVAKVAGEMVVGVTRVAGLVSSLAAKPRANSRDRGDIS